MGEVWTERAEGEVLWEPGEKYVWMDCWVLGPQVAEARRLRCGQDRGGQV